MTHEQPPIDITLYIVDKRYWPQSGQQRVQPTALTLQ